MHACDPAPIVWGSAWGPFGPPELRYKRRPKLKDIRLTDIYPTYASAINTSRQFINENLANFRRHLLGRENDMKKDGSLLARGQSTEKFLWKPPQLEHP